jgi:hypothetical protein
MQKPLRAWGRVVEALRLCGFAAWLWMSRGADRKMPRRTWGRGRGRGRSVVAAGARGCYGLQAKVRSFGAAESGSLVAWGLGASGASTPYRVQRGAAWCSVVQAEGQMVEGWASPTERHDAASLLAQKTVSSYPTGLISPAAECRAMGFGRGLAALGQGGVPGLGRDARLVVAGRGRRWCRGAEVLRCRLDPAEPRKHGVIEAVIDNGHALIAPGLLAVAGSGLAATQPEHGFIQRADNGRCMGASPQIASHGPP